MVFVAYKVAKEFKFNLLSVRSQDNDNQTVTYSNFQFLKFIKIVQSTTLKYIT